MSSEPYTPTEEELAKNATVRDRRVVPLTRDERLRGLAKVRADALREAANLVEVQITGYVHGGDFEDGVRSGHRNSVHRIRDEADRIEQEASDGR